MEIPKRNEVIVLLQEFKATNPWQGKIIERKEKFIFLHKKLNELFGKNVKLDFDIPTRFRRWTNSGNSEWDRVENKIILRGRLSVVTYIHEYFHALDFNQTDAQKGATELFKEVFPEKYEKLLNRMGMLIKE